MLSVSLESFSYLCFPSVSLKTRPLFILDNVNKIIPFTSLDYGLTYEVIKCSVTRSIGTSVNSREARVCPVSGGYGGIVLLLTGFVEHRKQLSGFYSGSLQIDHRVCSVSIVGVEDEVTMKISGVQSRQRQTVTVPREGSLGRSHGGSGCRGVQIMKEMICDVTRDASALQYKNSFTIETILLGLLPGLRF